MTELELDFKSALIEFNTKKVKTILQSCINQNDTHISVPTLLENVLTDIGDEWEKGELALSQVYMSGQICDTLVQELYPYSIDQESNQSNIAIVTFNDFHTLGKKITLLTLRSVGFKIMDIGQGVDIDTLIDIIKKENIKILIISVLMLPSALKIQNLREQLSNQGIELKILVGGAPFNFDELLWEKVGADAMGRKPADAINVLNNWLETAK